MKLNSDGTTTPFDSLQTFELGMMDGCVLGKLSKAGTDTNYFYGVTQPFYFVADSSADSGVVSIRVGVIDMNPQNRILNNNNPIENDNPVSCANLDFIENLCINANLVVGDECDERGPDDRIMNMKDEFFQAIQASNNDQNCNVTNIKKGHSRAGWTGDIGLSFSQKFNLYDPYLSTLGLIINWGLCINNINTIYPNVNIVDFDPVNNTFSGITKLKANDAIKDFKRSKIEGGFSGIGTLTYYPLPKTTYHEKKHIEQDKNKLFWLFTGAIWEINHLEPPENWCEITGDPINALLLEIDLEKKVKLITAKYLEEFTTWQKVTNNEPEANEAGHNFVINVLIPKLKEYSESN